MKTVGDFKKAGLVFVKGDNTIESDGSSSKDYIDFDYDGSFNKNNYFDCSPIESFAWRENAGVNPEFKGLIEFTFNGEGCEMQEVRNANNINWAIVKKWRPSLNQPKRSPYDVDAHVSGEKVKPVFTQEMADAGELPPAGSVFLYCNLRNPKASDWREVESKYTDDDCMFFKGKSGVRGFVSKEDMAYPICKPIDTRTPKQKAVDEMVSIAIDSSDDIAKSIIYEACVKLVSAGYRKC